MVDDGVGAASGAIVGRSPSHLFFWPSGFAFVGQGRGNAPTTRCPDLVDVEISNFTKQKKKRQLPFPDVTLQDGKSTVVVDAETETKKRVTGPDDQRQKANEEGEGKGEQKQQQRRRAATGRWPPRPRGQASWRGVPSWPWLWRRCSRPPRASRRTHSLTCRTSQRCQR